MEDSLKFLSNQFKGSNKQNLTEAIVETQDWGERTGTAKLIMKLICNWVHRNTCVLCLQRSLNKSHLNELECFQDNN